MSDFIKVLDHGSVRLVDHMGTDLSVVRAARVSYNADWREPQSEAESGRKESDDVRLIHYLMRNRHTSPFEAVTFTFEVKAPIFIFRQWHRHRTWSFNEVSARYTELPDEYYVPEFGEITTQSKSNKQGRTLDPNPHAADIQRMLDASARWAHEAYQSIIAMGCPRELARIILPVSTYSRMFATVNLHNLFGFLKLRLHEHAQWEIQVYAQAMFELIRPIVPVCAVAFQRHFIEASDVTSQPPSSAPFVPQK